MQDLFNFDFYSRNYLKIKTKMDGLRPFVLRDYQRKFIRFWDDIKGPVRIIVLKPRQAGFSTLVAGKLSHEMLTRLDFKGIALADKFARTSEIQSIYSTMVENVPSTIKPMLSKDNSEEIYFENPDKLKRNQVPGLRSGIKFETAQDPNAGRSGSRRFAHLSENAFYRYYREIDEGVQNSVPMAPGTAIIKESTANGRAGIGKPFFDLWKAAESGDSIYKPFFVAWYEVDDYIIKPSTNFKVTKKEREILKQNPSVTEANLAWRRLKIKEYLADEEDTYLTPEERFKQDFPINPDEAFRHSGQPVFEYSHLSKIINRLTKSKAPDMANLVSSGDFMLETYRKDLKVFAPPRKNKQYFIGADVSEGLSQGDFSSACVMDSEYNQVASWHGKIDPDLFGHLLISLGRRYNNALLIPENNNMGHTTVTTIRNEGYYPLYKTTVEDKVTKEKVNRYGWKTTAKSKQDMLNEAIKRIRDEDIRIMDIALPREMEIIARESNGGVDLNGKDRVVAFCLTLMGIKHYHMPISASKPKPRGITGTGEEVHRAFMMNKSRNASADPFD